MSLKKKLQMFARKMLSVLNLHLTDECERRLAECKSQCDAAVAEAQVAAAKLHKDNELMQEILKQHKEVIDKTQGDNRVFAARNQAIENQLEALNRAIEDMEDQLRVQEAENQMLRKERDEALEKAKSKPSWWWPGSYLAAFPRKKFEED